MPSNEHALDSSFENWVHPTQHQPKTVNVIALGPTSSDWHTANCAYDPIIPPADETWTLNKGFRTQVADMVFIMDDLIGEKAKSNRYYKDIMGLEAPVITSIVDEDVRRTYQSLNLHRYPIASVIDFYGQAFLRHRDRVSAPAVIKEGEKKAARTYSREEMRQASKHLAGFDVSAPAIIKEGEKKAAHRDRTYSREEIRQAGKQIASYLKNSIPLILAYAGFLGVRTINLFGADYDYPGQAVHEADKANAEYWCGLLIGLLGMEIKVSSRTTLLSTNQGRAIYGYGARQPVL